MNRSFLFEGQQGLLHGGDYNPDQWLDRPDILQEDVRLMKKAHVNTVSLGIFSWAVYEPVEGEYHFEWLQEIIDTLYQNGICTVLATPSGARPAWLDRKYEEVRRVNKYGVREHHGIRHNHCMSSPVFRQKVKKITEKLYEAVGTHPGVKLWHISNELGGECYCPLCTARFQEYLRKKFHNDIQELNKAWWNAFWSHNYSCFEEIEPPLEYGESSSIGLDLEWRRFTTWNMTDYLKSEIETIRGLGSTLPITTNFMELYEGLDYREMEKELDVISWDSYPRFHNDHESFETTMWNTAFHNTVMQSMKKDRPFMLMESAPGLVNWHVYNKLKRPYVHRLFSLQAVACGSDTVQYFQWRKGRGGYEQYHGAVVDHLGTDDTRTFREVAALGEDLEKLAEVAGSVPEAEAALILDWDTMWAVNDMMGLARETKQYAETCMEWYRLMASMGLNVNIIPQTEELSEYKLVVAPMMYMLKPETAVRLKEYVQKGGQLLATYVTGYVDQNQLCYLGGFPGDGLKDVFGVISEEIDTFYPTDRNQVTLWDGSKAQVRDYAELLRVQEDVRILGQYDADFYQGMPAVTEHSYGAGTVYYVAARMESHANRRILELLVSRSGLDLPKLPEGVEYHVREAGGERYIFLLNLEEKEKQIDGINGTDLLTQKLCDGIVKLEPYGVMVVKAKQG